MAFEQFTTTMGNQKGCDQMNARFDPEIGHKHDGSEHNGPPIDSTGLAEGAVSTSKVAPKAITAEKLSDTAIQDKLGYTPVNPDELGDLSLPGIPDYIARGRKIIPGDGLQVSISSGVDYISGQTVEFAENTLDLPVRSACLLYDKADGTSGYVAAVNPVEFIDDNTVGMWVFNQTGAGAVIPNVAVGLSVLAVENNLVPSGGMVSVDGWSDYAIKLDGITGYYTSSNYTNIPIVAAVREFNFMTKIDAMSSAVYSLALGASSRYLMLRNNSGKLEIYANTTSYDTGFVLTVGRTYLFTIQYDGSVVYVYVNGRLVYQLTIALNTAASNLYVGRTIVSPYYYAAETPQWLEIRNSIRTPQEIAKIANRLLLPNFYTDTDGSRKSIKELLPSNATSIGFVRTNSSEVIEKNDTDYKYGRREGAIGGNRKVFLGWQAFSGSTVLDWDNPFGTRKVGLVFKWAQDAAGTNESPTHNHWQLVSTSNSYGVSERTTATSVTTITITSGGAAQFNSVWQTSGYIGCYAEVLEND